MNLMTCALLLLTAGPADDATTAQERLESAARQVSTETTNAETRAPLHQHPTLLSMLRRNNELRRGMGLRPQRINPVLTEAAQNHAWYMARTGSFSHYSNRGPWGRARRFGFGGNVRENIAQGQGNVLSAFHSWRNSGGHWASIISDAPEVGFGYARSKNGSPYWVAVYGYPTDTDRKQVAAAKAELKTEVEATPVETSAAETQQAETQRATAKPADDRQAKSTTVRPATSNNYNNNYYRRPGILRRLFR
ncbi:MAG: CAP domain-containing protein [Pirellulaceae bacterium]